MVSLHPISPGSRSKSKDRAETQSHSQRNWRARRLRVATRIARVRKRPTRPPQPQRCPGVRACLSKTTDLDPRLRLPSGVRDVWDASVPTPNVAAFNGRRGARGGWPIDNMSTSPYWTCRSGMYHSVFGAYFATSGKHARPCRSRAAAAAATAQDAPAADRRSGRGGRHVRCVRMVLTLGMTRLRLFVCARMRVRVRPRRLESAVLWGCVVVRICPPQRDWGFGVSVRERSRLVTTYEASTVFGRGGVRLAPAVRCLRCRGACSWVPRDSESPLASST